MRGTFQNQATDTKLSPMRRTATLAPACKVSIWDDNSESIRVRCRKYTAGLRSRRIGALRCITLGAVQISFCHGATVTVALGLAFVGKQPRAVAFSPELQQCRHVNSRAEPGGQWDVDLQSGQGPSGPPEARLEALSRVLGAARLQVDIRASAF